MHAIRNYLHHNASYKERYRIQAEWPKSGQNLSIRGHNIIRGQNGELQAKIGVFKPDLGHFAWIWAIMLGLGPFCLDLGHIAWIWAIWQNLGQNRPQRRRSPEDGAGGTNRRTDGRTDSPRVLQDFVPFGAVPSN